MHKDEVKGAGNKAKGAVKEAAGKATGNRKLEAEGKADKAKGHVQSAGGKAKDAARHYARELWPEHEAILRVKKNHGLAEAALMARWFFLAGPGRDVAIDDDAPVRAVRRAA